MPNPSGYENRGPLVGSRREINFTRALTGHISEWLASSSSMTRPAEYLKHFIVIETALGRIDTSANNIMWLFVILHVTILSRSIATKARVNMAAGN